MHFVLNFLSLVEITPAASTYEMQQGTPDSVITRDACTPGTRKFYD